jgi:hypothetical protein
MSYLQLTVLQLPPKIEPPKGLKEGFKFHRYQLDAISWMKSIENNVDKGNNEPRDNLS